MHLLNQQFVGTSPPESNSLPSIVFPITPVPVNCNPSELQVHVSRLIPSLSRLSFEGSITLPISSKVSKILNHVLNNGEGDDDFQLSEGQASRRLWQLEEFMLIMERVHEDFICEASDTGKAKKKYFLIYAVKANQWFGIVRTIAHQRQTPLHKFEGHMEAF